MSRLKFMQTGCFCLFDGFFLEKCVSFSLLEGYMFEGISLETYIEGIG